MKQAPSAKIAFSEQELLLANNREWILTKHSIINKVEQLFAELIVHQNNALSVFKNCAEWQFPNPKISKGEKYQLLPYVILDHPRIFSNSQTFAIRCMFWWGNFYSISLQLSGNYQKEFSPFLVKNFDLLQEHNFYISTQQSPWEHDFQPNTVACLTNWDSAKFEAFVYEHSFIKITKKIPLKQWDEITIFFDRHYDILVQALKN